MSKAIPNSIKLGFFLGLLVLVLSAYLPYDNFQQLKNSEHWVDHTMEVLETADALRIAITDAESGQRGFLLTRNSQYLEPYNDARTRVTQIFVSLTTLTADNPSQQSYLKKIEALTTAKFQELQLTIDLHYQQKSQEALAVVATNQGNDLMQGIRKLLDEFQNSERKLLHDRVRDSGSHYRHVLYSFLFITLLNLILFSILYFFIVKNLRIRQASEIASHYQTNLLSSVINNMSEGLYVMDNEGKTVLSNPTLADIYGKNVANVGLNHWQNEFDISRTDGMPFRFEDFPAIRVLNGEAQATAEMVLQAKLATAAKIVKVTARPLLIESGISKGVVCITSDVSAERKSESKLRLAIHEAEVANKAKSDFVANMSHEIRTPMNAVLGVTQLLAGTSLSKEQKKYLDMIALSGRLLLNILNDILDFSKIEAGKIEIVPVQFRLSDVLRSLAATMSMAAEKKNIELIIDAELAIPPLLVGDSHRLQQILVNLVSNAIKFTDSGEAKVTVSCREQNEDHILLCFSVKDTGVGMTEEQQGRLFSPFTQADSSITRKFGGTGLGLTISRRLAELMGGTIHIQSAPGAGSNFSAVIPFALCKDTERRVKPRHSLQNLHLLVIESNASARATIANYLSGWSLTADFIASFTGESSYLLNPEKKYNVILIDWQLFYNEANSDFISKLALLGVPVIVMMTIYGRTHISEENHSEKILKPYAFIFKPLTSSSLLDVLNEVFHGAENENSRSEQEVKYELQGIQILLVEDNEFNQIVARDFLEKSGAMVDVVDDGKQAVDVLANSTRAYDLILMDVQMPVMDGFTATKIIRQELSCELPIIAMTAGVTEAERNSCILSGMDDLIAKPIEPEKVLETIIRHCPAMVNLNRSFDIDKKLIANPSSESSPAFDISKLLAIGQTTQGHNNKTVALINNLIQNSIASFEHARVAMIEGNYAETGKILHRLRGSLGVVGAKSFVEKSYVFELNINESHILSLPELFREIEVEFQKTIAAAKEWIGQNSQH